ncbi:hypothetical protein V5799_015722 [Amblyomma americanum]|uniref:Uncharacterized protein n=1 Tax=Amblyomma americanum TaxID=6943 RepID=A0AAQ4F883_AMBAM
MLYSSVLRWSGVAGIVLQLFGLFLRPVSWPFTMTTVPPDLYVGRHFSKTFHIVEFTDEVSTYVVPESWVKMEADGATCYWPPTAKKEVDRMILLAVPVEDNWEGYKARILATKSTYERAKECLPHALMTSHLDSEGSVVEKKSRRKRKAVLLSDSESDVILEGRSPGTVMKRGKGSGMSQDVQEHIPIRRSSSEQVHIRGLQDKATTSSWGQDSSSSDCEAAPANTSAPKEAGSLPAWFTAFEKKVFDNQMRIIIELKSLRSLLTASKAKRALVLPQDCPKLPASTGADVQAIEEYLSSEGNMEVLPA